MTSTRAWLVVVLAASATACPADDPQGTPDGPTADAAPAPDGGPDALGCPDAGPTPDGGDPATCMALAGDYTPRVMMSMTDPWPACVSDDGLYHPFDANISSLARVAAFEQITALLAGGAPGGQAFLDARLIYVQDQGLESRVARREDEHYPPAPMACRDLTPVEQQTWADRCVGPARIQPLVNQAFQDGALGVEPAANAARVEAGLLWFLYVSVYKEAATCAAAVADCDSHFAYYTGGEPRAGGQGLARRVRALSVGTHDRAWDGILAVRCWRDLDNPTGPAMDLAMRGQALAQLDRALLRAVALVVRDRALRLRVCGGDSTADWAFVRVLGPVLDREATLRDPAAAAALRAELAKLDPAAVDVAALLGALDALFPCP